jgi:glycogen debranching enzyme
MKEIRSSADDRIRVLKQGDSLAVLHRDGTIRPGDPQELGLFHGGVRQLAFFEVSLNGRPPVPLSSTVRPDGSLVVDLADADLTRNALHVFAKSFLWRGAYYVSFRVHNYSESTAGFELALRFAADGHIRFAFAPAPSELTDSEALFRLRLPPRGEQTLEVTISLEEGRDATAPGFGQALEEMESALQALPPKARIATSNDSFNAWLERSESDVRMMLAGDRDSLLAAYEMLWLDPSIALATLSGWSLQDDCGAADTTPLFVALAGAYWRRTADRATLESVWPHVERALSWIDGQGDPAGGGFFESPSPGWKDSADSVFHRDGTLAEGPFALCEVQGYVYAARRAAAVLARALGHGEQAERLEKQAEELRERFERSFWCEEISTYCLALDGQKRPCEVRTSNAGQCLFTGIASRPRAWRVTHTLLNESSFSGWGIRTLDSGEARYNPMSRHNGSVWPHDNALIALGMARYGRKDGALRVLSGLFEASRHVDLHRMPELLCGFRQRSSEGPALHPLASAPRASAAGAVFLLLQACMGFDIDAPARRLRLKKPELPAGLDQVKISNLGVGEATVDLVFERFGQDVAVRLDRREGEVEVLVVK